MLNSTYLAVRRALVFIIGVTVVLVGVVMLVTPGPAIIVIPAGLALLATEFLWARRLLARLKRNLQWRRGAQTTPDDGAAAPDSDMGSDVDSGERTASPPTARPRRDAPDGARGPSAARENAPERPPGDPPATS